MRSSQCYEKFGELWLSLSPALDIFLDYYIHFLIEKNVYFLSHSLYVILLLQNLSKTNLIYSYLRLKYLRTSGCPRRHLIVTSNANYPTKIKLQIFYLTMYHWPSWHSILNIWIHFLCKINI